MFILNLNDYVLISSNVGPAISYKWAGGREGERSYPPVFAELTVTGHTRDTMRRKHFQK